MKFKDVPVINELSRWHRLAISLIVTYRSSELGIKTCKRYQFNFDFSSAWNKIGKNLWTALCRQGKNEFLVHVLWVNLYVADLVPGVSVIRWSSMSLSLCFTRTATSSLAAGRREQTQGSKPAAFPRNCRPETLCCVTSAWQVQSGTSVNSSNSHTAKCVTCFLWQKSYKSMWDDCTYITQRS